MNRWDIFWKSFYLVLFVEILVVQKVPIFSNLTYLDIQTHNSPFKQTRFLSSNIKAPIDNFLVREELWVEEVVDFDPCLGFLIVRKCRRIAASFDIFPIFRIFFLQLLTLIFRFKYQSKTFRFWWSFWFKIDWYVSCRGFW